MAPPTHEPDLRKYYAARAAEYDLGLHHRPEREPDVAELRALVAPLVRDKAVLDVACGTGAWSRYIAQFAQRVVGVDASAEMLDIAKRQPADGRVTFALADAYALDPGLGTFDAAFAGFWVSHIPRSRLRPFFEGLARLLAPGATVVLVDNTTSHCTDSPVVERDAEGNTVQRRTLRDGSVHRLLKNFPTEAELVDATRSVSRRSRFVALEHFWLYTYESR